MSGGNGAALGHGLLYSQCWEDVAIAREALRIRPGAAVLAIGSAGDNALALLQDDPERLLVVDVNRAQTALVELKMAAIRCSDDPADVRAFLGASGSGDRGARYDALRPRLSPAAREHWDAHRTAIEAGVIDTGRFERYLAAFRRAVFPFVPGARGVRELLGARSLEEQARVYRERWDTRPWRALFRVYFSRAVLGRLGRDPAFFAQCELEDIGGHYLTRARHAFTELPIWENPYLSTMLSGVVGTGALAPEYLRPEAQATIRARLDRVSVETATLDATLRALPSASVDAFYLSDVFELAGPAEYEATLGEIARVGRHGARLCYWNNLVPRQRPDTLADRIASHPAEAERLFARDRAFLYSRFVVESVRGAAR